MLEEFNALLANGTWSLVPKQPQFNIIGNKWVFRLKRDLDGSITRYKARLVAKGFINVLVIILKPIVQSLSLKLSNWFSALLSLMVGLYVKWMLIKHFFMVVSQRIFTCLNHQVLSILTFQIMYASFTKHCTVSNKHLVLGIML